MEYNRLLVAPGNLDAFAAGLINLNNFLGNNKETLLSYRGSWLGSLRKKILKMLSQMFFAIHKDLAARVMDRTMEIADPGKMSSPHCIDSQCRFHLMFGLRRPFLGLHPSLCSLSQSRHVSILLLCEITYPSTFTNTSSAHETGTLNSSQE